MSPARGLPMLQGQTFAWEAGEPDMLWDLRCAQGLASWGGALAGARAGELEHLQRGESSAGVLAARREWRWELGLAPSGSFELPSERGWMRKSCLGLHPCYLGSFQSSYYLSQRSLSEYLGFPYIPTIPAFSFPNPHGCVIPVGILVHVKILEREEGRS